MRELAAKQLPRRREKKGNEEVANGQSASQQYLRRKIPEMPMARRQRAGRPANGPIEHDPDRPLLTQMQLQLPNLPELINS